MYSDEYWNGKTAKIEILKDNHKLIYTATEIKFTAGVISFNDRTGTRFGFPISMIQQMQEVQR